MFGDELEIIRRKHLPDEIDVILAGDRRFFLQHPFHLHDVVPRKLCGHLNIPSEDMDGGFFVLALRNEAVKILDGCHMRDSPFDFGHEKTAKNVITFFRGSEIDTVKVSNM